ncbi:MAG: hypothetical protein KF894_25025 [Labilithrix sp.]|nr:hypothetical protein [Labilithrix sp.]
MRRRRNNHDKPREKRTLIPSFDPEELAKEIEREANRTTISPPFDPSSYARIVEQHVSVAGEPRDTPRAMAAAAAIAASAASVAEGVAAEERRAAPTMPTPPAPQVSVTDATVEVEDVETVGREMYGCYLASDFPEALVLAERVLAHEPEHALAQLVAERCRERLQPSARALSPSSVLRLRFAELERQARHIDPTSSFVLGHIDGVSDAATVAALTGLPGAEALSRLHALVDLGVLEVVGA